MSSNMYIHFEDPAIAGTSRANGHEHEIEILSFNHGFSQPTAANRSTAGSGTVDQASHSNLTFTKYLDAASTELLKRTWAGQGFGKATISLYRGDGSRDDRPAQYLTIFMEHVLLSNLSVSGGPDGVPVESVSLEYGLIRYDYIPQKGVASAAQHDLRSDTIT